MEIQEKMCGDRKREGERERDRERQRETERDREMERLVNTKFRFNHGKA